VAFKGYCGFGTPLGAKLGEVMLPTTFRLVPFTNSVGSGGIGIPEGLCMLAHGCPRCCAPGFEILTHSGLATIANCAQYPFDRYKN